METCPEFDRETDSVPMLALEKILRRSDVGMSLGGRDQNSVRWSRSEGSLAAAGGTKVGVMYLGGFGFLV